MKSYECEKCGIVYYGRPIINARPERILVADDEHSVCDKCEKLFELEHEEFVKKFFKLDEARKNN